MNAKVSGMVKKLVRLPFHALGLGVGVR